MGLVLITPLTPCRDPRLKGLASMDSAVIHGSFNDVSQYANKF